jgi:hypothetical protein
MPSAADPKEFPRKCSRCDAVHDASGWATLAPWQHGVSPAGIDTRHCHCGAALGVSTVAAPAPVAPTRPPLRGLVIDNPWAFLLAAGITTRTPDLGCELPLGAWVGLAVTFLGDHRGWKQLGAIVGDTALRGLTHDQVYERAPREHLIGVARVAKVIKPDPNPAVSQLMLERAELLTSPIPLVVGVSRAPGYTGRGSWTIDAELTAQVRAQLIAKKWTGYRAANETRTEYVEGFEPLRSAR